MNFYRINTITDFLFAIGIKNNLIVHDFASEMFLEPSTGAPASFQPKALCCVRRHRDTGGGIIMAILKPSPTVALQKGTGRRRRKR
jgi:hypothetical protein